MIILFFNGVENRSRGLVMELLIWRALQLLAGDICPDQQLPKAVLSQLLRLSAWGVLLLCAALLSGTAQYW